VLVIGFTAAAVCGRYHIHSSAICKNMMAPLLVGAVFKVGLLCINCERFLFMMGWSCGSNKAPWCFISRRWDAHRYPEYSRVFYVVGSTRMSVVRCCCWSHALWRTRVLASCVGQTADNPLLHTSALFFRKSERCLKWRPSQESC
jgi:hypothetical protein